jgi:hypothetical protein
MRAPAAEVDLIPCAVYTLDTLIDRKHVMLCCGLFASCAPHVTRCERSLVSVHADPALHSAAPSRLSFCATGDCIIGNDKSSSRLARLLRIPSGNRMCAFVASALHCGTEAANLSIPEGYTLLNDVGCTYTPLSSAG